QSQLKTRLIDLHAAVAKALATFHHERLNQFASLLAYHYEAAGLLSDASNYAMIAARWVGSTNPGQAILLWQKVRDLLQCQPLSVTTTTQRIMANAQIAWLGWREGMTAESARIFVQEGLSLAPDADNSMVPMLLFVDGRITLASGGSADIYVERVLN